MKSSLKAQISIKKTLLRKAQIDYENYINLSNKYTSIDRERTHYLALSSRLLPEINHYKKEILFLETNEELS
jgi:hypothetical protein